MKEERSPNDGTLSKLREEERVTPEEVLSAQEWARSP